MYSSVCFVIVASLLTTFSVAQDSITDETTDSRLNNAGSFLATVEQLTDSVDGSLRVIRLDVRLKNATDHTLILAYRARSSSVVDDSGNSYYCCFPKEGIDRSASGIGTNNGKETDPQFILEPKQSDSVTFKLFGNRNQGKPRIFRFHVTIDEMDSDNPKQLKREHALHFGDLKVSWSRRTSKKTSSQKAVNP